MACWKKLEKLSKEKIKDDCNFSTSCAIIQSNSNTFFPNKLEKATLRSSILNAKNYLLSKYSC